MSVVVYQIGFVADIAPKSTVSIVQYCDDDFEPKRFLVSEGASVRRTFGERDQVECVMGSDALMINSIWSGGRQVGEWIGDVVAVMPARLAMDFVAGAVPVRLRFYSALKNTPIVVAVENRSNEPMRFAAVLFGTVEEGTLSARITEYKSRGRKKVRATLVFLSEVWCTGFNGIWAAKIANGIAEASYAKDICVKRYSFTSHGVEFESGADNGSFSEEQEHLLEVIVDAADQDSEARAFSAKFR